MCTFFLSPQNLLVVLSWHFFCENYYLVCLIAWIVSNSETSPFSLAAAAKTTSNLTAWRWAYFSLLWWWDREGRQDALLNSFVGSVRLGCRAVPGPVVGRGQQGPASSGPHPPCHMTTPTCKGVKHKSLARWAWVHGNTTLFLNEKEEWERLCVNTGYLLQPQTLLAWG